MCNPAGASWPLRPVSEENGRRGQWGLTATPWRPGWRGTLAWAPLTALWRGICRTVNLRAARSGASLRPRALVCRAHFASCVRMYEVPRPGGWLAPRRPEGEVGESRADVERTPACGALGLEGAAEVRRCFRIGRALLSPNCRESSMDPPPSPVNTHEIGIRARTPNGG